MKKRSEEKDRRIAILVAGIVHIALLLIFLFVQAFSIPDPPPGEQYVEISMADYGSSITGSGDTETETPSPQEEEVVEEEVSEAPEEEVVVPDRVETQSESAISAPTSDEESEEEEEVEEEPKVTDALNQALENMNSQGGGGGDGDDEDTGNEGNEEGNIDGQGVVGGDDGVEGELGDRALYGKPSLKPQEEGKVVLNVYVDRNGQITRFTRNYDESNTTSDYLFRLAEEAIKDLNFQSKQSAPPTQKGKITFNFKLQ